MDCQRRYSRLSKRVRLSKRAHLLPKIDFADICKDSWEAVKAQQDWVGQPAFKAMWNDCCKAKTLHQDLVAQGRLSEWSQAASLYSIKLYDQTGKLLRKASDREYMYLAFDDRQKAQEFYDQVDLPPLPKEKEPLMWNSWSTRVEVTNGGHNDRK